MYAVTGITGKVGSAVAKALLGNGAKVRAVLRDPAKGESWAQLGCEIALAEMTDAPSLSTAFEGVEGVFLLIPSCFDPTPGFPEVRQVIDALQTAIASAKPPKIVCLSTIGAQAKEPNLLNQLGLVEQALGALDIPVAFLRAAWFMENAAWDVSDARRHGTIQSFLQPLDQPVPMVATSDIGVCAAAMLRENWQGRRVVELEGPNRVTPNDLAAGFAAILGQPVEVTAVPRGAWEEMFRAQGAQNPVFRARMLDGFNEGWICFEGETRRGATKLRAVLTRLVQGSE